MATNKNNQTQIHPTVTNETLHKLAYIQKTKKWNNSLSARIIIEENIDQYLDENYIPLTNIE